MYGQWRGLTERARGQTAAAHSYLGQTRSCCAPLLGQATGHQYSPFGWSTFTAKTSEWTVQYLGGKVRFHGKSLDLWANETVGAVLHVFTITVSLYLKPHKYSACMFSCSLPPALLAEWPGSLHAPAVTWGGTDTRIRVSTESWPCRRKYSCHLITSPVLYHQAIPAPLVQKVDPGKEILLPLLLGLEPAIFQS